MSDELARVLAAHGGPTWTHRYGWRCGCGDELASSTLDEIGDAIAAHAPHLARAVLASGVVVSADKVRAVVGHLRDLEKTHADARAFEAAAAVGTCRLMVDDLLSEPATDAAPTGEARIDDDPCGGTGVVECWSPGGPCEVPNAPGCETCGPCLTCHRSAVDATTPPDTHPSDPRPVRNAQEGEQR